MPLRTSVNMANGRKFIMNITRNDFTNYTASSAKKYLPKLDQPAWLFSKA